MCGIVGIVGINPVTDRLIEGLKRLEYRGYDSAGIAVSNTSGIKRVRAIGKVAALEKTINKHSIDGSTGIGHTRWATHGKPTEVNAHPHFIGKVCVVHNGIIENYQDIRDALPNRDFESETDTEVIAHLIDVALERGLSARQAFTSSLKKLQGAYALGVMIDDGGKEIYAARAGSPLAIGIGDGEIYLGSDALALEKLSQKLVYLEEGDWAVLRSDGYEIFDINDVPVQRMITTLTKKAVNAANKGGYDHFMLKEIYQQPSTISATLAAYISEETFTKNFEDIDFNDVDRLVIVACGTACYAGQVAKYWFEQWAGLAVDVDIASEFRYRNPVLSEKSLFIAISQSGETADTLAALRYCKETGIKTAALVNVMTSTMAREADMAWPLDAGPEIGVASTKAFTSQLTALASLALLGAQQRGQMNNTAIRMQMKNLINLPYLVENALRQASIIRTFAGRLAESKNAFFLGRGLMTPIALEGALKLKEISYIHAEGYAAGELKHGPIALIEDKTPVIVIAPHDRLFEKTLSNMQEVIARGADIFLFTDKVGKSEAGQIVKHCVALPKADPLISPIVQTIGMQLLAYYTALELGTDVDQPRNLAKSVTVE